MNINFEPRRAFRLWPLISLVALTLVVGGLGYRFVQQHVASDVAATYERLASVGSLKAAGLGAFLTERAGDARVLSELISRAVAPDWWHNPNHVLPTAAQQQIASVITAYGYASVLLLDTHGEIRFNSDHSTSLNGAGASLALRALTKGTPQRFSEIYQNDPDIPAHVLMDTFAPITATDGSAPLGVLVLRGRWGQMFSLLDSWPVPSATSETLLVRKEGSDVVFLTDPLLQPGAALKLRYPLNATADSPGWPAISAVQGRYGEFDSIDYRGQRVFAYTIPVPHSDWSLVTKVDANEALADIFDLQLVSIGVALVVVGLGTMLGLWLRAHRRAEDALRDSEARYHSVVAALAEGIVLNARDGAITACNASAERILGLTKDQMCGRTPMDARWRSVHEDGSPFPGDTHPGSVTLRTSQPQVNVVMGVHKPDGTLTWISINSVPIFTPGETLPAAVVASFVDITASKHAELELRISEQRLKEAQCIGKLGSVDWDLNTNALVLSDEARVIYGLDKSENSVALEDIVKLLHPDDAKRVELSLQAAVAGTARHDLEHRMVRPDGTLVYVRATAELVHDSHGKPARLIGTVLDITERMLAENMLKRTNEELEQRVRERTASLLAAKQEAERANNAKSTFLSSMSHELRTPMNAILGFSQLIDADTVTLLAPDHKECVREILHAGDHLLHLINEVLDLSHVESGRMNFSYEPVALTPLIRDCLALMRPLVRTNQLQSALAEHSSAMDMVRTDRHRVRQVILNLMSNAVKYNRPGGSVTVACTPVAGEFIRLSVHDTGLGISEENRPRLFKTFERLEVDRYRVDGTGIGLALCKQLIERMGGRIGVDSTLGVGSTFWFELPATALPTTAPIDEQHPAPAVFTNFTAQQVLFIEDNPANMRLMQRIFAALPTTNLVDAHTGELGIELAIGHRPALILLDITLPGIDGYEVLRRLREHPATRHIPVVAVTANATPADIERGKQAGFTDYLPKPFDVQRLLAVVKKLLAESKHDSSA